MTQLAPGRDPRGGAGLAALVALGIAAWWMLRTPAIPADAPHSAVAADAVPAAPSPAPKRDTIPASFFDGVPIRPAGSAEVDARGMVPHPITPTHERIFHENNLIGDLNGAMDAKDTAGLRRLLKQYRDEYPEDAHVLQDGYELVANCLDQPSRATRAVAQRYYDEQLDSGLRRYIRRYCLEAASP
jgi:hypothetical protein